LEDQNISSTWGFRLLGFFILYLGIFLLFSPLIYVVRFIPLVGYLLSHGISYIVWVFAFVVAITLTALTIAMAWVYYRPIIGFSLLAVVALGCYALFLVNIGESDSEDASAAETTPAPATTAT
jgi:hypothetical protein